MEIETDIITLEEVESALGCDCVHFEELFIGIPKDGPFPDQYTVPGGPTYRAVSDTLIFRDPVELKIAKNMSKTLGKIKHLAVAKYPVMTIYRYE